MRLEKEISGIQVDLKSVIAPFPDEPGVYIFKDEAESVLYVGKAKSLKKRISSYLGRRTISRKISSMMNRAKYLEFIITSNEKEALFLESNLIKRFTPRYNVVLRDDKRYPCLRIDLKEPYPRLVVARKMERQDGVLYLGPFHSASSMRSTLKLINKIFQLRSCKKLPKDGRPCLNYQIGRCLAPCAGNVSEKEYMDQVQGAIMFLKGKGRELLQKLEAEMFKTADRLEFEKAARIRDQIAAIKKVLEKQYMISPVAEDMDVIGIAHQKGIFQLMLLMVREGYVIGSKGFPFKEEWATKSEILEAFLKQYYPGLDNLPEKIIIPFKIKEINLIGSIISESPDKHTVIKCPSDKTEKELIKMAKKNAEELLNSAVEKESLANMLKEILHLKRLPRRIEAVDISQIRGKQRVGSIVAFTDGLPDRKRYRNFRIKGDYMDDYSMMAEVVRRRIKKGDLPDLFIIDGGRAHLMTAARIISEEGIEDNDLPDIIAIAKSDDNRSDRIYLKNRKEPILLPADSPVLLFIMKIRDEVHRRAITYHRKLRGKEEIGSLLLSISGIGPQKMRELLNKFNAIDEIMRASVEDIARVRGIGPELAKKIKEFMKRL